MQCGNRTHKRDLAAQLKSVLAYLHSLSLYTPTKFIRKIRLINKGSIMGGNKLTFGTKLKTT